jgi:hypothetical protein
MICLRIASEIDSEEVMLNVIYQATVRRLNEGRSELGDVATASPRSAFAKVSLHIFVGVILILTSKFVKYGTGITLCMLSLTAFYI